MSLKSSKSKDFDRNLDASAMVAQIRKNQYKGSEILKDASNAIAPFDTGQLRNHVNSRVLGDDVIVTWEQDYAGVRYFNNKKNPHTTKWIEKGFMKKRSVLMKVMTEGVTQ